MRPAPSGTVLRRLGGPAGATLLLAATIVFVWSRTAGLGLSLYHDEVYTVTEYVQGGPRAILFGRYVPNNHPLFSMVTWATWLFGGDSELVFRFWSVVPAVAISIGFVAWVFWRWGPVPGIVVGLLVTTSPLIASLTVLARGYGLAMFGVGSAVICGIEGIDRSRPKLLVCSIAGVTLAVLTLPVLAFAAVGVVIALWWAAAEHRRVVLVAAAGAVAISGLWYLPLVDDLLRNANQEFGSVLSWHGPLTGPLEHLLFPTLRTMQPGAASVTMEHPSDPRLARIAWFVLTGAIVSFGLFRLNRRDRSAAIVLALPVVTTFAGLTLGRWFVEPRFVSSLFFPLSVLVAVGIHEGIRELPPRFRSAVLTGWAALGTVLVISVLPAFQEMTEEPIEAFEPVGRLVATLEGPVITNSQRPIGLQYYVESELEVLTGEALLRRLCGTQERFTFIEHPLLAQPVDTSCLEVRGAERSRFLQRDRGNYIDVWDVPRVSDPGG